MGRKTTFNQAVADAFIERLEKGEPLEAICRDEGMPSSRTILRWRDANPEFAAELAGARAAGFDQLAAQCLTISDNRTHDTVEDDRGRVTANPAAVARDKLMIETRLKLLAVWARSKYGEHATLQVEDSRPGISRTEMLAALQSGSIDLNGLLASWTKPAERIEAESEPETTGNAQATEDDDLIDID